MSMPDGRRIVMRAISRPRAAAGYLARRAAAARARPRPRVAISRAPLRPRVGGCDIMIRDARPRPAMSELARNRRLLILGVLPAALVSIAMWLAIYALPRPVAHADVLAVRLLFAFKWICLATLFCFVTGIESIAHRRMFSRAIDPLAGADSEALRIDARYAQNTLEQLVIFALGVVGLAWLATSGRGLHAVSATSVVWMINRAAFWIGYHRGARFRGIGLPSMALGLVVLVYVCARFGYEDFGVAGAVVPVAAFLAVEALLFRFAMRDR
jgi:hypothetical protein